MGFGNLQPGGMGAVACECCCNTTFHTGSINKFFPWITGVRLITPGETHDFARGTGDTWSLSRTVNYDPASFAVPDYALAGGSIYATPASAQVPVSDAFGMVLDYRDAPGSRTKLTYPDIRAYYLPTVGYSISVVFSCVAGKPTVRLVITSSQIMGLMTNTSEFISTSASDYPTSDLVTYFTHSSSHWFPSGSLAISTADMNWGFGLSPNQWSGTILGDAYEQAVYLYGGYEYGEPAIAFSTGAYNQFDLTLSPSFDPLGILQMEVQLLS